MKANVPAKTELIYFRRKDFPASPAILVKGSEIKVSDSMKILGTKFQKNLGWDVHFENLKRKSRITLAKL